MTAIFERKRYLEELPVLHATLKEHAAPRKRGTVRHLVLLILVLGAHPGDEKEHRAERRRAKKHRWLSRAAS